MNIKLIKDRTMLKIDSIGLSLCLFANRDGPKKQYKKLQKGTGLFCNSNNYLEFYT